MAQIILGPNRAYPALPTVGDDLESHRRAIEAIVECIQIHERRTNDVLDSFVRVQELETLGLVQIDGKIVSDVATEESTTHHHDSTYLRLDGTNDPVTGSVSFSGGLSATGLTAGGAIDFSGKTSFTGLSGTELDDAANIAFLNQAEIVLSAWTFNEDVTLDTAKLIIDDGVEQITLDAGVIIGTYHGIWLNQTAPDTFNYALLGDTGGQTYLNAKTRTYIRINNSNMFDIDNTSIDVHRPMRMMTNNKLTLFDSLGTTSVELDFNSTTFEITGVGAGAVHIDLENIGSLDFRSGAYLVTRDSTNVDALTIQTVLNENRFTGTGVTSTSWINPGIFDLKDGATLRIRDALDTDYVDFSHDGTDFNATATATTNFTLTGFTGDLELSAGMGLKVYDATNADYLAIDHDGVDINMTNVGTTDWNIIGLTGYVWLRDGAGLKISDAGDIDFVTMSHDGTNFNINATNTSSFDITGASNYQFDSDIQARDGAWVSVKDATNADSLDLRETGSLAQIVSTVNPIRFYPVGTYALELTTTKVTSPFTVDALDFWAGQNYYLVGGADSGVFAGYNIDSNAGVVSHLLTGAIAGVRYDNQGVTRFYNDTSQVASTVATPSMTIGNDSTVTFAGAIDAVGNRIDIQGASPRLVITETDGTLDNKVVRLLHSGEAFYMTFLNDAETVGTDFVQVTRTTTSPDYWEFINLDRVRVRDGASFWIMDAGDTDYVQFSHDGTDFNIAATNTTDINFTGATNYTFDDGVQAEGGIEARTGSWNLAFDATNADYIYTSHSGTHGYVKTGGTGGGSIFLQPASGSVGVIAGFPLRVYDPTNVDYVSFQHDGTDFNIAGTNTTDINFTGATGFYQFSNDVRVAGGGFQSNGVVQTSGLDEQIVFVDVSGGRGRIGSYNWFAGTYQPMLVEGSNVRINTRGGDAEFYDSSTLWAHFDQNLSRFDYFGLDVRIRDGGDLFVYDATDTVYLQAYNDGTHSYLNASANQMRFHIAGALKMGVAATYNYDYQPRLQLETSPVAATAGYGQWYVRNTAPNLPYFRDDTNQDRFLNPEVAEFQYKYDTETLNGVGTASGEVRFNSATPSVVATMWIHENDYAGRSQVGILNNLQVGDTVLIKQGNSDTMYFRALLTSVGDSGSYMSIGLNVTDYGTTMPSQDEPVHISFYPTASAALPTGSIDNSVLTWDNVGAAWIENPVLRVDEAAGEVRFYQPGTNDHMEFTNDGNDLLVTGVNLATMAFVNLHLEIRDNVNLQFGDIGDIRITFDTVDLEMTSLLGNWAWQLRDGVKLTLWDSTDADSVEFHHDGTDFNTTFGGVATTDWNIVGLGSYMWLRDGAAFRISDAGDTDYVEWNHTGVDLLETYTGTANKEVNGLTGAYKIKDGAELRVYDPADTDYITLNHNGTNANIDFDSTTDYLGIGLSSSGFDELRVSGVLKLNERPSAHTDTAAFGQLWVKSNVPNELWFTNDAGADFPVGYNTMPILEQDAAYTFLDIDKGKMIHKDAGLALTFTCDNVAAIPQGAAWVVHNDDTEDLTIAQGTGVTIYWLSGGAAPTSGNVTVKQGGIVTVYKYTDTEYWVWGNKEASAGIGNVVEDTTPQLGGDLDTNNFDILVGDGDFIKFGAGLDFTISHDGASNDLDINSAAGGSEIHLLNNMHLFFHGGAKTADFQYDGTDFAIFMSSADPFQLHGASQLDLRDGCDLIVRNSDDLDWVTFAHNGTDFTVTGTNTTNMNIVGMGLHLGDNLHQYFGDAEDVDIYFNATDFYVDLAAAVDFRLRGGSVGTDEMITAIADGGVYLYHDNVQAIATQLYTATGNTSAAVVDDHGGTARDIGFNVLPTFNMNVSDTLEAQHCGKVTGKTNTTAYTLTGPASTDLDFPVGGVCTVMNLGTSINYTISDTVSCTMYHVTGSAVTDIAGSGTLAPGGIVTLWRYSSTAIYIWGSGFTA